MVTRAIGIVASLGLLSLIFFSPLLSNPSMNSGSTCAGSGCHTFQAGILSAVPIGNLQVRITLTGITSGNVAGELVNGSGTVVAMNNQTSSNPFTLTAPGEGFYKVNAGYKNPSRRWDSVTVNILATDVGATTSAPREFRLDQNYPNPFNPTTTIEFALPATQLTTLKVFDVQGREIATLVDQQLEAGTHAVRWDAGILPSGVYFYRLQAGTFVQAKKLLLMR